MLARRWAPRPVGVVLGSGPWMAPTDRASLAGPRLELGSYPATSGRGSPEEIDGPPRLAQALVRRPWSTSHPLTEGQSLVP